MKLALINNLKSTKMYINLGCYYLNFMSNLFI
jgi:hypothetical protein